MLDVNDRIERLLDLDDIRQLPKLYCHYVRKRDIDNILNLYSEDCVFESPPIETEKGRIEGSKLVGKDALRGVFARAFSAIDAWPFTHNHIIEFTNKNAADGYVYAEIRSGDENMKLAIVGVYEDKYVRENGVWLFKSRSLKSTNL